MRTASFLTPVIFTWVKYPRKGTEATCAAIVLEVPPILTDPRKGTETVCVTLLLKVPPILTDPRKGTISLSKGQYVGRHAVLFLVKFAYGK